MGKTTTVPVHLLLYAWNGNPPSFFPFSIVFRWMKMMTTTNVPHMPVTVVWKSHTAWKKRFSSPFMERAVMQLTTYAEQLLWVGASVAANSGLLVYVCVCPCRAMLWLWPTHAAEFVNACARIKSLAIHSHTWLVKGSSQLLLHQRLLDRWTCFLF